MFSRKKDIVMLLIYENVTKNSQRDQEEIQKQN